MLEHADSGADDDSVTNVGFWRTGDTKIAAVTLRGSAL